MLSSANETAIIDDDNKNINNDSNMLLPNCKYRNCLCNNTAEEFQLEYDITTYRIFIMTVVRICIIMMSSPRYVFVFVSWPLPMLPISSTINTLLIVSLSCKEERGSIFVPPNHATLSVLYRKNESFVVQNRFVVTSGVTSLLCLPKVFTRFYESFSL